MPAKPRKPVASTFSTSSSPPHDFLKILHDYFKIPHDFLKILHDYFKILHDYFPKLVDNNYSKLVEL
jgi:hypothetical protein